MEPTIVLAAGGSFVMLYAMSGVGSCIGILIALYNLIMVIGFMREQTDGAASAMSKASWGVGCLALLFMPCGWFFGLVAIILSRVETGRIYRDESPLASATPTRMGSLNGAMAIVIFMLYFVGAIASFALGSADAAPAPATPTGQR